jgi:hypothetical protein
MIAILTQNHAIVNASNFSCIYVDKLEDDDKHYYVKIDNGFILGQYENAASAIEVINWISKSIAEYHVDENIVLSMPYTV